MDTPVLMWVGEAKSVSISTRLVGASVFAWGFLVARDTHNEYRIKQKVDDVLQMAHHFGAKW